MKRKRGIQVEAKFEVSAASVRRPYAVKAEGFETAAGAGAAFVSAFLERPGSKPKYAATDARLVEAYSTKGGLVLVLIAEDSGFWRVEVWANRPAGFHAETVLTVKSARIAKNNLMTVFSGLCAAERALS